MKPFKPRAELGTHEVTNMPPHMGDQDLWASDAALREGVTRERGGWAAAQLSEFGRESGSVETFDRADVATRVPPRLQAYDRYGMRINQVEYHPAYHELMTLAVEHEVGSFAWRHEQPGGQVVHAALNYMMGQPEGGVTCPMAMVYSAIPSLRMTRDVADEWVPQLLSTSYDPRDLPVEGKTGATIGMFMTEKQGGSDVRANSTRAVPIDGHTGPGAHYRLSGHKFFCSAPMCDAFLTLAYSDGGLSCFLMPRWSPDGQRNTLLIQRLKDKLGNRANASSEIELDDAQAVMVGEEGRGIPTIIEMVQGNRYWCCATSAALMRQGLVQALHNSTHRQAFQKRLIDQPLMRNVLADLAVEVEAALVLTLRVGRAMDEAADDPAAAALARISTAIGKYWICKRASGHTAEALECLGGPGFIEDSMMPRLYRDAPLNSIWEGSGNVICLDVLRAMQREEATIASLLAELEPAVGGHPEFDRALAHLRDELADPDSLELRARGLTETMALCLQGALLIRHAPNPVADAFCGSRLASRFSNAYGTLSGSADVGSIIERAGVNSG